MTDQRIRAALERAVELGEVGLQVAAYRGEDLIVDAWIGEADETTGEPVDGDTLFAVFSVSKAFVATAVHLQAERGLLDVDAPVATYWQEYGSHGKERITIRHVLQHRAGVPQMPSDLTPECLSDWNAITEFLSDVEPMSEPGAVSMYHSISYGYILAEVVRRTDPLHRGFSTYFREEITEPLGIRDLYFGLPEELEPRVATLTWGAEHPVAPQVAPNPIRRAMMPAAIEPSPQIWNAREIRASCIPAASAITSARAGAKLMAMLANRGELGGRRFLSEERLMALTAPRPNPLEVDVGIGMVTTNGVGGFWVGGQHPHTNPVVGRAEHTLAHGGAGGSIAWADLDARVGVMITHNRMFGALPEDRHPFVELADTVRQIAAELGSR